MTFPIRAPNPLASLALAALAACTAPESSPTGLAPSEEPLAAKPSSGSSPYSVAVLAGTVDYPRTEPWGVNDAGMVAGHAWSTDGREIRGFIRIGGAIAIVPPATARSSVRAISNGDPTYVIGSVDAGGVSGTARWTITNGVIGDPEINSSSLRGGGGVNDLGTAIGGRWIWPLAGSSIEVLPPADYTTVDGTDIDNEGHAVFNASGSPTSIDRAHVRFADGEMLPLRPPAGYEAWATTANTITEVSANGVFYVSGSIQIDDVTCFPALWTVSIAGRTATPSVRFERNGSAAGVSTAGTLVGVQGSRWSINAYAWPLAGAAIKLPVPKSMKNPKPHAISPDGRYVVGYGEENGLQRQGLVWSGTGP